MNINILNLIVNDVGCPAGTIGAYGRNDYFFFSLSNFDLIVRRTERTALAHLEVENFIKKIL